MLCAAGQGPSTAGHMRMKAMPGVRRDQRQRLQNHDTTQIKSNRKVEQEGGHGEPSHAQPVRRAHTPRPSSTLSRATIAMQVTTLMVLAWAANGLGGRRRTRLQTRRVPCLLLRSRRLVILRIVAFRKLQGRCSHLDWMSTSPGTSLATADTRVPTTPTVIWTMTASWMTGGSYRCDGLR
jgi:hypothetical protein